MGGTSGSSRALDRRTKKLLVERLNRDGAILARRFSLTYRSIEAERANVTSRYGICYSDGVIKIRLRHAVTGRSLKYSSLVNTLCHELAHLRYFNHGERFKLFYQQILEYARAQRIYRPGRKGLRPESLPEPPMLPLTPRRQPTAAGDPAAAPSAAVAPITPVAPTGPGKAAPPPPEQLGLFEF